MSDPPPGASPTPLTQHGPPPVSWAKSFVWRACVSSWRAAPPEALGWCSPHNSPNSQGGRCVMRRATCSEAAYRGSSLLGHVEPMVARGQGPTKFPAK